MSKTLTRDEAHTLITNVFYSFHGNDMVDPVRDKAEATRFKQGLSALSQLYGKKDYIEAVEALSMEGFTEYFNIVGDFWKLMNVESSALFENAEIVSSATLGNELGKADDAGKITSLISGFTPLEIVSLTYDDKMRAVNKILDDWFVFDDKEQALLTLISSMNEEERKNFFSALMDGENPLLSKLLSKVNGAEKVSLFMYINTLLLMSGIETDAKGVPPTVRNDFWAGKSFMAFYVDGKINIVQHEATLLGTRIAGNWSVSPFSTVSYTYGADKTFNVPAFFLTDQGALENAIGEQNFVDVIWGAVQGEFNENPTGKEILADIGINFIPIVGQICDARDIAACLEKLINQGRVTEVMVWVTLLLTAVGCIPYAGDVVKGALKAIVKGADDVALVLVKKVGGDNVVIALRLVSSKLDDAVPEIRKLIQGWAEEAAEKGSPNAAQFFAKMDEMINAAVREIKGKIDDFGRRVGGEAEESITPLIRNQRRVEAISKLTGYNPTRAVEVIEEYQGLIFNPRKKLWEVDNITIRQESGRWIYNGPSGDVPEWKIKNRHNDVCSSRTTGTKTLFQSHHGIQDAWASKRLEAFGYKSENAPTIMLRDSCRGTPHQAITANQAGRKAERDLLTRTYKRERDLVKIELLESGVPQASINEYLLKADTYFKQFYDKMNPTERLRIFGNFSF